ncbi:tRNA-specific adenosine deaminase [Alphaproteobacteria bacterium]|nr:tRNA-specific adenosine deaminase [Alphaproteobacteria bacterium]
MFNFLFMREALRKAQESCAAGCVPVGALIVFEGKILIKAHNNEGASHIPPTLQHAEFLVALEACCLLKTDRLGKCDLYVTLEPCPFCAAILRHLCIRKVFFGAYDPKGGGLVHHGTPQERPPFTGGLLETESAELLRRFFQAKR